MTTTQADLVLAGHRLRLRSTDPGILADAAAVMVPPCHQADAGGEAPGWRIEVETATGGPPGQGRQDGLPVVSWPQSGRRLVVHRSDGGVIEATGAYREGAALVWIEADARAGRTRVLLPPDDPLSRRWPDWLARSFFGARLLSGGWLLVHASAVRVVTPAGPRAVLVVAGSGGGKSTLAYRACRELGAGLMADDLALVRAQPGGVQVIGWPTRACVPVEVLDPDLLGSLPGELVSHRSAAGRRRSRLTLRPPEYERLLGISRAGPELLGGIICPSPADGGHATASRMTPQQASGVLAAASQVPGQRAAMTDLVGLTGVPAIPGPRLADGGRRLLPADGSIPVVAVGVPDMSLLPALPVWDLIGGRIPGLEQRR
jgi:hypothetical protein